MPDLGDALREAIVALAERQRLLALDARTPSLRCKAKMVPTSSAKVTVTLATTCSVNSGLGFIVAGVLPPQPERRRRGSGS